MDPRSIRTRLVDLITRTGSHLFGISYYQLRLTKSRLSWAINTPFAWWKTVIQLSSMFTNSGVATRASRRRIPAKKPGSRHSSTDNRLRFVTVQRFPTKVLSSTIYHLVSVDWRRTTQGQPSFPLEISPRLYCARFDNGDTRMVYSRVV